MEDESHFQINVDTLEELTLSSDVAPPAAHDGFDGPQRPPRKHEHI